MPLFSNQHASLLVCLQCILMQKETLWKYIFYPVLLTSNVKSLCFFFFLFFCLVCFSFFFFTLHCLLLISFSCPFRHKFPYKCEIKKKTVLCLITLQLKWERLFIKHNTSGAFVNLIITEGAVVLQIFFFTPRTQSSVIGPKLWRFLWWALRKWLRSVFLRVLAGSHHFSLSDYPYVGPPTLQRPWLYFVLCDLIPL